MNRQLFILVLLTQFSSAAFAQTKVWDKTFGGNNIDNLNAMVVVPDGYLLTGTSLSGISGDKSEASRDTIEASYLRGDYWVVKMDTSRNKVWDKTFGGSAIEILTAVVAVSDGYLLAGTSFSGISGDKSEANRDTSKVYYQRGDYWVVKIDADGNKIWDKTYGGRGSDRLHAIIATADGGYLLGGYSHSDISGDKSQDNRKGSMDYWVVKIDAKGTKLWDKTFGGNNEDDLNAILATEDGGFLLGGYSDSDISGEKTQNSRGYGDFWVVKVDANGTKLWDKTFGGNYDDKITGIIATADNGYLLCGSTYSVMSGDKTQETRGYMDYWIVKIDANGTKLWDKSFGGNDSDYLTGIVATEDGGYLLGGYSSSEMGWDKSEARRGMYDYWVVKINGIGIKLWDKTWGGNDNDYLTGVVAAADGGYLLGGYSSSGIAREKSEASQGWEDFWVVKIKDKEAPTDQVTWNLRYGGTGIDRFTVMIQTSDGGYLSGGYSNSVVSGDKSQASRGGADYWIVKTDAAGTKQWDKRYGGNNHDYLNRIIQTQDGGYLLAGSSTSSVGGDKSEGRRGDQDYWIVKISSSGEKQWDKTYGGSGFDDLRKVNQLDNGGYLLAGTSNSPVSGEKSHSSLGGKDYWIIKISSTGTKIWDRRFGGSGEENLESVAKLTGNGFWLAGTSTSGVSGTKTQPSRGGKDFWLVKINSFGNQMWDQTYGGNKDDELYSVGLPIFEPATYEGEFFVAGHSSSGKSGDKSQANQGSRDYWMLMLDRLGYKIWDKSYGGTGEETLRSVIQTSDGGFVLAGSSDSPVSGDKSQASQGGKDYWIVKTDAEGNKEYDQQFGGSGEEEFRYIQRTNDGGLLLGGRSNSGISGDRTQPSQGLTDYWLVKLPPGPPQVLATRKAVAEKPARPELELSFSVFPNPFSSVVTFSCSLPQSQPVIIILYSATGQLIRHIKTQVLGAGVHQLQWDGQDNQGRQVAAGVYFYHLRVNGQLTTGKLLKTYQSQ